MALSIVDDRTNILKSLTVFMGEDAINLLPLHKLLSNKITNLALFAFVILV